MPASRCGSSNGSPFLDAGPVARIQHLAEASTRKHADHGVLASVGSVGDAYDNALAESFVDSFKTELIADRIWRTRSQLELAVVEYLGWLNHSRLHESLGDLPPAEFEAEAPRLRPPPRRAKDRPSTAGLCAPRYRQKS